MYYTLDDDGYINSFSIGGIFEDGFEFKGELPDNFLENINAYKVEDEKLVFDEERMKELQENHEIEKEIIEAEQWFDEYDKKVASYNRCIRLGIKTPYDIDIDSLDNEAREKHNKLDKNKERLRKKRK